MTMLDFSATSDSPRGSSPEAELERLFLSVHRLSNAFNESGVLTGRQLGSGEWAVLGAISGYGSVQLKDVVRESGVSRQRIRKILQELELRGLVKITQVQSGDKRQRLVAGTDQGRALRGAILKDILRLVSTIAGDGANDGRLLRHVVSASRLCTRVERALATTKRRRLARELTRSVR